MIEYNTMRTINGAESLIVGGITLSIGLMLLWRGYGERRRWVRMVPGRVVIGAFLTLSALIMIQQAVAKLWLRNLDPGGVGRYINTWYVNAALLAAILFGLWSLWRLHRNTLGGRDE